MQYKVVVIKGLNIKKDSVNCGILIETKNGEEWFNSFKTPRIEQLNKGEEVALWLYREEYNGEMRNRFKLPSIDHLMQQMSWPRTDEKQESEPAKTQPGVYTRTPSPVAAKPPVDDTNDIRVEDIPF